MSIDNIIVLMFGIAIPVLLIAVLIGGNKLQKQIYLKVLINL